MKREIIRWLSSVVRPMRSNVGDVFEVGALNVNGSARDALQSISTSWIGCDRVAGPCVDEVGVAANIVGARRFDTIVACECYEHDAKFWETHVVVRNALKVGGVYVISFPAIDFPFHDYGGDFYRFTEMSLAHYFFKSMAIVDIATVGDVGNQCVVGCALKVSTDSTDKQSQQQIVLA